MSVYREFTKKRDKLHRLIAEIPLVDLEEIDRWGVSHGMPSRTATVRKLLKKGLEAAQHEVC